MKKKREEEEEERTTEEERLCERKGKKNEGGWESKEGER